MTTKMIVNADMFGYVCGHCEIPFEVKTFNAVNDGEERIVYGELRLCIFGHATDIKAEAHMSVFDVTASYIKVNDEPPTIGPEQPEVPEEPTVFKYGGTRRITIEKRKGIFGKKYEEILSGTITISGERQIDDSGRITLSVQPDDKYMVDVNNPDAGYTVDVNEIVYEVYPNVYPDDGSFGETTETLVINCGGEIYKT